jgi:hypothetical protein
MISVLAKSTQKKQFHYGNDSYFPGKANPEE